MALRLAGLCGPVLLALAASASAEAQEQRAPGNCAGLAPDSFEASVLNCGEASETVDSRQPPRVLEVLGPVGHNNPTRTGDIAIGGTTSPAPDEIVGIGTVQVIGELSGVAALASPFGGAARAENTEPSMSVPVGQRPPPGTCRIWFPDRHAGLQRPPAPCDIEVPDGAVLIRG